MPKYDIIEAALNSPIDWAVFEKLVAEILAQDDMPRLRRVGGYKDSGVDAYESALYKDERDAGTIVQITSQRAQTVKVEKTLSKLKENGLQPASIVFVFKHPVASTVRQEIAKQCEANSLRCDVRDQGYLVIQLGKERTGIFPRYFESVKSQFALLLSAADPLATASDSLRHAMLLSVASYVVHPQARLVRRALFLKTTLAALVAAGEGTPSSLLPSIQVLLPEEQVSQDRVIAALSELEKSGDCIHAVSIWRPSDACIAQFGSVMGSVTEAYNDIVSFVIGECRTAAGADQAALGFVERNIRKALLRLMQIAGPFASDDDSQTILDAASLPDLRSCLVKDLKDNVAHLVMIAFGAYVEDPGNRTSLSLFARSYSALSLRNIDPIGRRWQQTALQRSKVALDTDALLAFLVKELPEHPPIRRAIEALVAQGTRVVVTPEVVTEAAGHISRAFRTYKRFADQLSRFSTSMADAQIWHTIVRGYYYALQNGYTGTWKAYWDGYYDQRNPEEYIKYLVGHSGVCSIEEMSELPPNWLMDLDLISEHITKTKEMHRYKAVFREEGEMYQRVRNDIHMLMALALPETSGSSTQFARGYLISEDGAFFHAERHECWKPRRRVAYLTRALPQLAEFACGAQLSDDEVVRLMFEPAVVAAAESLKDEIEILTAIGIDLRTVPLRRLEWELRGELHEAIHRYALETNSVEKINDGVALINIAAGKGFAADSFLSELAVKYEEKKKEAQSLSVSVETVNERLKRVVLSLAITNKSRRRANRVLKEIGLSVAELEKEEG